MIRFISLFIFLFLSSFIHAHEIQDTNPINDVEISTHHPKTGQKLPANIPYSFLGLAGDGNNDKLKYYVRVRVPSERIQGESSFRQVLLNSKVHVQIQQDNNEPDEKTVDFSDVLDSPANLADSERVWEDHILSGEIDLSFDIEQMMSLGFMALFKSSEGTVLASCFTEITMGNPVLTLQTKITSGGFVMDGVRLTSEVSSNTGLAFGSDYGTLKGRGELIYEMFEIESTPDCNITTSKYNGSWRVEVVFPEGPTLIESILDTSHYLPPPLEVIIFIEPGIKEKGTIRCPRGFPPILPLPKLIHFFALFYSFHGGEIPCFDQGTMSYLDQPNEMDEGRGGLVISNWEQGTGNVIIGKRNYKRIGARDNATFEEDTKLVLKWPE